MYRCQSCNQQSQPSQPAYYVVVETREKTYPPRYEHGDPGGKGIETVKELLVCEACAKVPA